MTTAQETASPTDAAKRTSMGAIYAGILAIILLVLVVFPGIFAGLLSRSGAGMGLWDDPWADGVGSGWICEGTPAPVERIVFYPSEILMDHSTAMFRFYIWQFKMVGGHVKHLPPWRLSGNESRLAAPEHK